MHSLASRISTTAMVPLQAARRLKRVAILVSLESGHGREVMLGIHRYARPLRPWLLRSRYPTADALKIALDWQPHGIIAHTFNADMAEGLLHLNIPVVSVSDSQAAQSLPRIGTDSYAVGQMAAEHLLERGFRSFAYFGDPNTGYSRKREAGFRDRLRESGMEYTPHHEAQAGLYDQWKRSDASLASWLKALPKPVAIFACKDEMALLLSEACIEAQLAVPEEVAILGVDNDELTCDRAYPPLSSVRLPTDRVGYEAAKLLDRLMARRKPAVQRAPLLLPPLGVQVRRSTEIMAVSDTAVAAALQYINEHATKRMSVDDVLAAVPVCRRALEKRFRTATGRSLLEEIYRVRLSHARHLLSTTGLAMPEVAAAAGFRDGYHFWSTFRKKVGTSPAEFRKQSQVA